MNAIQIAILGIVALTVVMSGLTVWFAVLSARYRRQTEQSLRETEEMLARNAKLLGLPRRFDG